MTFHIAGIGTALPSELITQDDAARLAIELAGPTCSDGSAVQVLYQKAGVKKRHSTLITSSANGRSVSQEFFPIADDLAARGPTTGDRMRRYESDAIELAASASDAAIRNARTSTDEISHLVTVSCTGFSAPGVDIGLIERLGLSRATSRTHIGFMGCHGALNGLRVAAALSRAFPAGKVLLCCVELCSLHHQYTADRSQIIANALFSDGAAAIVGAKTDSADRQWQVAAQFSHIVPNTEDIMAWRIGDYGFEMYFSPDVPHVIEANLRPWLAEQLARHSLSIQDVKSWAIHPGGPRILSACADALALDHSKLDPSRTVLEEFGNMSSPTVLFILENLRKQAERLPCVVLAFGPGLTIEAALIA